MEIRPKKALGQHFLRDGGTALRIVKCLLPDDNLTFRERIPVVEVGPGTGVLTGILLDDPRVDYYAVELDREAAALLRQKYPQIEERLKEGDFLKLPGTVFPPEFLLIGNFPYNISSQIFFRILELRNAIPQVVGMVQKEVAERFCARPGSRTYGILSVLLQTWYHTEYLFTVPPGAFVPPPKVNSGVIRLLRNERISLQCPEKLFLKVIKTTFNQRRKTIRNSLKPLLGDKKICSSGFPDLRPEQLGVEEFVQLTLEVEAVLNAGSSLLRDSYGQLAGRG
ncbi:MAG: 16S rRNA (adenine(1518)-N(6)/adenine(1519)-N(6))-dimethyltransferase RsmA [Bacteroidales bacterium]|jgi:16S rRNA (adenine1518-N6/adenine1519-N6)-dimethyltransferase|nr:16S rRNA (adenine(1518)-N(6)/adenine(1519)-N(6))-dimethyltransferase RsmA [Bacteroidales bacterium]MDD2263435.1 16S rRNA (adenine(1518)-N(6)/adenine(1519)-N(6))-dimethyltransferase RsmA [Bacteroidales bacterium]MDD2830775.1 16S rRNA (adenine(1518)-N(6)/adenine(1519)-N(6))-dimethyltransferase RsmA [Bacteroidales bacterium]MDD3207974.1 16S rRNA (adenine(1518)-N(6)/adenine(1519)-N(6))-dimethyltransferase RsmA [Bacteroidales bacterium]MDD3696519.1 16S rRNA (adenine(1518)-N(6)/adenine(1519)-N(6))